MALAITSGCMTSIGTLHSIIPVLHRTTNAAFLHARRMYTVKRTTAFSSPPLQVRNISQLRCAAANNAAFSGMGRMRPRPYSLHARCITFSRHFSINKPDKPDKEEVEPNKKTVEPEDTAIDNPDIKTIEPENKAVDPNKEKVELEKKAGKPEKNTEELEKKAVDKPDMPEEKKVEPEKKAIEPEEKTFEGDIIAKVKAAPDLTKFETQLLESIVDTRRFTSSFDDISVPEYVIETLRTIITLPLLFPEAFNTGLLQREAMSGVLLYEPPGTGKTLLCRIAARECGARMLVIKPSNIMSRWLGESEKAVDAIFSLANRLAPCIVFIDEVDSCFRARSGNDARWTRDIMSEFLQAMDGLVSSRTEEGGVLVIGATNRPYDIDDAIIRRLPSRMFIGFPGVTEREAILKIHLKGESLDSDTDLSDIAQRTANYSGSDLKNLCVSAAMASLKEALGEIDWSQVSSLSNKQTKMNDESANKQTEEPTAEEQKSGVNTAKERLRARTMKMAHFEQAMKEVVPSSSPEAHRELNEWHEKFGSLSR